MIIENFINQLVENNSIINSIFEEHIKDNEGLLEYVFLGQLMDNLSEREFSNKVGYEPLLFLLSMANKAMNDGDEDLKMLIRTTVSESIDSCRNNTLLYSLCLANVNNALKSTLREFFK